MLSLNFPLFFCFSIGVNFFANRVLFVTGCKSCNSRLAREKRLLAVRGHILTKLGLTEPPSEDKLVNVSRDILQTYNSAVQEKEKLFSKSEECRAQVDADEEYFAKRVGKLLLEKQYAKTVTSNSEEMRDKDVYLLTFNTSALLSEGARVSLAELRLHQSPNDQELRTEVRIEVCENTEALNGSSADMTFETGCSDVRDLKWSLSNEKKWITLDVTSVVKTWLNEPDSNHGLKVIVAGSSAVNDHDVSAIYLGGPGSEEGEGSEDVSPNILVWYVPRERAHTANRRNRRSLDWRYCKKRPRETRCCLRSLYIDFAKDLRWTWIHAPKGFYANYCAGKCPFLWGVETQNHHTSIMALYNRINPDAPGDPCCVPKAYEPLVILYFKDGQPKIEELSNMAARECTCL